MCSARLVETSLPNKEAALVVRGTNLSIQALKTGDEVQKGSDAGFYPIDAGWNVIDGVLTLIDAPLTLIDEGSTGIDAVSNPIDAVQIPIDAIQTLIDEGWTTIDGVRNPIDPLKSGIDPLLDLIDPILPPVAPLAQRAGSSCPAAAPCQIRRRRSKTWNLRLIARIARELVGTAYESRGGRMVGAEDDRIQRAACGSEGSFGETSLPSNW